MQAPFDGRFKILAEDYPELLLRLLGILEPGMKPQVVDILRELQLDPVQVDHVYRINDGSGDRFVHLEAITSWSNERTSRLALYHFLLRQKYDLPLSNYIVLMAEKYARKKMPARVTYRDRSGLRIDLPYKVIKLWEIDPGIAFEPGCEALLPWAPLLAGGPAEFQAAVDRIASLAEDPDRAPYPVPAMISNLAVLAGLRYHKDVISHFLEGLRTRMMVDTELFAKTWLYKDGVKADRREGRAEGLAEGKAEGLAEGKAEGKAEGIVEGKVEGTLVGQRISVRVLLSMKFPEMGAVPEIDQIHSSAALEELLPAIVDAASPADVIAAIQIALRVN